jgi:hypothetical protein
MKRILIASVRGIYGRLMGQLPKTASRRPQQKYVGSQEVFCSASPTT